MRDHLRIDPSGHSSEPHDSSDTSDYDSAGLPSPIASLEDETMELSDSGLRGLDVFEVSSDSSTLFGEEDKKLGLGIKFRRLLRSNSSSSTEGPVVTIAKRRTRKTSGEKRAQGPNKFGRTGTLRCLLCRHWRRKALS
jgi:hypothetical protein